MLDVIGCCWTLLGVAGCCWVLLDIVSNSWVLLGVVGCCWVLLAIVERCRALLGVGHRWVLLGAVRSAQPPWAGGWRRRTQRRFLRPVLHLIRKGAPPPILIGRFDKEGCPAPYTHRQGLIRKSTRNGAALLVTSPETVFVRAIQAGVSVSGIQRHPTTSMRSNNHDSGCQASDRSGPTCSTRNRHAKTRKDTGGGKPKLYLHPLIPLEGIGSLWSFLQCAQ